MTQFLEVMSDYYDADVTNGLNHHHHRRHRRYNINTVIKQLGSMCNWIGKSHCDTENYPQNNNNKIK